MALFNLCMKFEIFLGQMTSFEMVKNSSLFIHKVPSGPSKWIKVDKWDTFQSVLLIFKASKL